MSERIERTDALKLIDRIRSPHLSFNKFPRAQQLYDIARRPYATIPAETEKLIENEIDKVVVVLDVAISDLNPVSFNAVLELEQVKASSFGGQATVRRFLRGSNKNDDFVLLSKYLADLRSTLSSAP
jgi:hypothetical protein